MKETRKENLKKYAEWHKVNRNRLAEILKKGYADSGSWEAFAEQVISNQNTKYGTHHIILGHANCVLCATLQPGDVKMILCMPMRTVKSVRFVKLVGNKQGNTDNQL